MRFFSSTNPLLLLVLSFVVTATTNRHHTATAWVTSSSSSSSSSTTANTTKQRVNGVDVSKRPSIRIPFTNREVREAETGDVFNLYLEATSLIGGPKWLPIHVRVVLVDVDVGDDNDYDGTKPRKEYEIDFVPINPTDPSTTLKLVRLQYVPGEVRIRLKGDEGKSREKIQVLTTSKRGKNSSSVILSSTNEFCNDYPERDLHLIFNNCWTFAFRYVRHLSLAAQGSVE